MTDALLCCLVRLYVRALRQTQQTPGGILTTTLAVSSLCIVVPLVSTGDVDENGLLNFSNLQGVEPKATRWREIAIARPQIKPDQNL